MSATPDDGPDEVHLDWFGNPVRADGRAPVEPVACPFCGTGFTRSADLETHVAAEHGVRTDPVFTGRRSARLRRWAHGLGWLPAWFVAPVCLTFAALVWAGWWDDVFRGGPEDPWYLAKLLVLVFLVPLLPTLYVSARIFDRKV